MQVSIRSYIFLLLWFAFVALCTIAIPYFANDFRYMLIQGTHEVVGSLSDVLVSQYEHYFNWGGRSVAHTIAQLMLWWGKPIAAVSQAFCYVLLIAFIYFNAYGIAPTLRLRFMPIFIITVLLFTQMRGYGEVVFNVVSSANYLYTTTLVLMFILPYRISLERELTLSPFVLWPLIIVLGLVAGWTNENTAAAVAAGLGIYLLYNLKTKRLKVWQCLGYLAFLLGFALLILAPGNAARFVNMEEHGFNWFHHLSSTLKIFATTLCLSFILLGLSWLYLSKIQRYCLQVVKPGAYYGGLLFGGMGLLSLILMIFSPNFPIRSTVPFSILLITALIGWRDIILQRQESVFSPQLTKVTLYVASLYLLVFTVNTMYGAIILAQDYKGRTNEVLAQLEAKQKVITVTPLEITTSRYIFVADVRHNPDYWTNKIVTNFLQLESIARTCDYPKTSLNRDLILFSLPRQATDCVVPASTSPH